MAEETAEEKKKREDRERNERNERALRERRERELEGAERRRDERVTVTNLTGDGKPHHMTLEGDVAEAYKEHMAKPLVHASDRETIAEQVTQYLAIFTEQGVKFDYVERKCNLHKPPNTGCFFNAKSYECVTEGGRRKLASALATDLNTAQLSNMLIACSKVLADAPRVERESASQAKVDLSSLIQSLAQKAKTPQELAAMLEKLIK